MSWADTGDLALHPITGLFGANGSGKSGLLHAILLLKQTSESRDRRLVLHFGDDSTPVDLGDFASIVHGHTPDNELQMSLDWECSSPIVVKDVANEDHMVATSNTLGFSVSTDAVDIGTPSRPVVRKMAYRVGQAQFGMRRNPYEKTAYELHSDTPDHPQFGFLRSAGRSGKLPAPDKCYGFPDLVRACYQNAGFLADLALEFEQRLDHIAYLGPLRVRPVRQYTWAGA